MPIQATSRRRHSQSTAGTSPRGDRSTPGSSRPDTSSTEISSQQRSSPAREPLEYSIIGHRRKTNDSPDTKFDLRVYWYDPHTSEEFENWEDEEEMHTRDARAVYAYWKTVRGGRKKYCHDLWHIHRIVDDRVNFVGKPEYKVQWVGSTITRWQPADYVELNAEGVLNDYLEEVERAACEARLSKREKS